MAKTTTTKSKTKKVTKKVTASKVSTKITKHKLTVDSETLRKFHIANAVLLAVLAIAAGYLMSNSSYQLFVSMLTRDALASQLNTVFVPAIHAVVDVQIMWLVGAVALTSAFFSILFVTKLAVQYNRGLKAKSSLWRWVVSSLVGMFMVQTVALLNGVQDLMTLKVIGALVIAGGVLGLLSERQNIGNKKPEWTLFIVSQLANLTPWLVILVSTFSTLLYGMVRSPWYVYAVSFTTLLGFVINGLLQYRQHKKVSSKARYELTEFVYLKVGMLTNLAFVLILIIGLKK